MSEPSYRGKGQPALSGGRIVGWLWSEAPPVYLGTPGDTPAPPPSPPASGGLISGLQRLLGASEESMAPRYRQAPHGSEPKRPRLKGERARPRPDE